MYFFESKEQRTRCRTNARRTTDDKREQIGLHVHVPVPWSEVTDGVVFIRLPAAIQALLQSKYN
jgi:hypothetical protein